MKSIRTTAFGAVMLLLSACGSGGVLSDSTYRRQVVEDLEIRQDILARSNVLDILEEKSLAQREREALQFLYAYMPLGDAINYDGDFFLRNVRASEQAREQMPWGAVVPDLLYRHFVLPVRVNNEDIDESRMVFFDELRDRVKELPMSEAILEVNHWCHEKATYTPSDSRTSSPLSVVRTAMGRCGEESTFLVAALRSVGIPARQVYTPRWSHTDDNHAWVEAWADGKWHFLGACEPEPVLNLGWFNAPASRGMFMYTNVFGRYYGPEQVMRRTDLITEINITDNYARTGRVCVTVVDTEGRPVPGATVEYKVYNYSELYSVATQTSDEQGRSSLMAGCGDAVVWASKGGLTGISQVSFSRDTAARVVLDKAPGAAFRLSLNIVPPPEEVRLPPVTEEQRAENTRRSALEDSIRNAYTASFRTREQALAFAREKSLDPRAASLLVSSKGNYARIEKFLSAAAAAGRGEQAVALLESISQKDLQDTPDEVLSDHLFHAQGDVSRVMNPRVAWELLSPYRSFLQEVIPSEDAARYRENPELLAAWCRDSLRMEEGHSLRLVPIRPAGVWRSRVADPTSRDIFFVAMCRSLEIPAWRDAVTGKIRYLAAGKEYDVDFGAAESASANYGTLKLNYTPTRALPDLRYRTHFSLSRLVNGRMQLLNFDRSATWQQLFRKGVRLEAGDYVLVSGTRLASGEVLAEAAFFSMDGGTTTVDLIIPEERKSGAEERRFDTKANYLDADAKIRSLGETLGAKYSVLGILGAGEEPTNHALQDMSAFRRELEELGSPILLLFSSSENALRYKADDFASLPSTVRFGTDVSGDVLSRIAAGAELGRNDLPLIVVTNAEGHIVFLSSGYSIGLGERLVKELKSR